MNVGKSKVVKCLRYLYGGRMYMRLNGKPLWEVDCFRYLRAQMAGERDVVHRMNEGYKAWGALKCVLSNRGLGIIVK